MGLLVLLMLRIGNSSANRINQSSTDIEPGEAMRIHPTQPSFKLNRPI